MPERRRPDRATRRAARWRAPGFVVGVASRRTDRSDPGTVLAQTPAAGTEADKGATVSITVAKEPAAGRAVPDVVGEAARPMRATPSSTRGSSRASTTRDVTDKPPRTASC